MGTSLNHEGCESIKDSHRKAVTAVLLENQEKFLREQAAFEGGNVQSLMEAPTNSGNAAGAQGAFGGGSPEGGPTAGFDPVLISLIRRSMPNLVAYDLAGVQPMSGPTGLIFAMRSAIPIKAEPRHSSTKQTPHSLHRTREWVQVSIKSLLITLLVLVLLHSGRF